VSSILIDDDWGENVLDDVVGNCSFVLSEYTSIVELQDEELEITLHLQIGSLLSRAGW
jgi:hypothetical protein